MRVQNIIDEDIVNYKKTSMFIGTIKCDGKCWKDLGMKKDLCQNNGLYNKPYFDYPDDTIIDRYIKNPISKAIVFGGLEPLLQKEELLSFIDRLRVKYRCDDDVVIYTGYYPWEVDEFVDKLVKYNNIIIKYGRYVPNKHKVLDPILGIELASDNQYAVKIS